MYNETHEELKPCPWCGDTDSLYFELLSVDEVCVVCEECLASGPRGGDNMEAVIAWNARAVKLEDLTDLANALGFCNQ